jgi:dTDP-4-amino-4,6-dideoxygalactose transaminase
MAGGFLLAYQLFSMSIFAAPNKSELVQTGIMREIQMVDLVAQYAHIQEEIDAAVLGVIRSAKYIGGPEVDSFKKEFETYLGVKHVIPCANGTDALQIAMMALGLKPGDEVITPTFTYIATAEVIALLGLTPVLVDVEPNTFTIDIKQVEAAITSRTKAIVPVHLYGQCADMERLLALADKHGIHVIEDNAQAIGSDYNFTNGKQVKAGTMGIFGCTSFFPSKNLGCFGDGGAIMTNDDNLAHLAKVIASHGQTKLYVHDEVGCNSRLDAIQAAVLRVKLPHLDQYIVRRKDVANRYDLAFKDVSAITIPFAHSRSSHVYHQYTMVLNGLNRDALRSYLAENGITSMVYYPIPLHKQKAFKDTRYDDSAFPVTDHLCDNVISLPIHTEMDGNQQQFIINHVLAFARKTSN